MKHFILLLTLVLVTLTVPLSARNDIVAFCYHQVEPKAVNKFSLSLYRFKS